MEFFREVDVRSTDTEIQKKINSNNIEKFSSLIFPIGKIDVLEVQIGGIWGEFTLCFQKINGGIRLSLQECPNALAWTITTGYPPNRDAIILHLTINRQRKHQIFIEEINEFLNDHIECLKEYFAISD